MRKFIKRALVPLAAAAALFASASMATASFNGNCTGVWHQWTSCIKTSTSGIVNTQAFSSIATPYKVHLTYTDGRNEESGWVSDLNQHTFSFGSGTATVLFYNGHSTNAGQGLYHLGM